MSLVVVERSFSEPQIFSELQAVENAHGWCLEMHGVTFDRSYFSLDRTRMICLYQAPDAEAVRRAQRQAGLPVDRAWAALELNVSEVESPRSSLIVVERSFSEPVAPEEMIERERRGAWCLEQHRVVRVGAVISTDHRRTVCVFAAPDAEAVRDANRMAQLPFDRAWPATVEPRRSG